MTGATLVRGVLADLKVDTSDLRSFGRVQAFRADSDQLLPLWRRLRGAHEHSGLWPMILGTDRDVEDLGRDYGRDADREVARGLAMDVVGRLAEFRAIAMSWADEDDDDTTPEIPPRGEPDGLHPHDEDAFVLAEEPGWLGLVTADDGFVVPGMLTWLGAANYDVEPGRPRRRAQALARPVWGRTSLVLRTTMS